MYYAGTVLLKMNEDTFWRCTPRKLHALLAVHRQHMNGTQESEPEAMTPAMLAAWFGVEI